MTFKVHSMPLTFCDSVSLYHVLKYPFTGVYKIIVFRKFNKFLTPIYFNKLWIKLRLMTEAKSNKAVCCHLLLKNILHAGFNSHVKRFLPPLCVNMQRPNKLAKHFLQNYPLQLIWAGQGIWACGEVLRGVKAFYKSDNFSLVSKSRGDAVSGQIALLNWDV